MFALMFAFYGKVVVGAGAGGTIGPLWRLVIGSRRGATRPPQRTVGSRPRFNALGPRGRFRISLICGRVPRSHAISICPRRRKSMAQLLVKYRTPRDAAAFDMHYFEKHVSIAKKIPGMRKYEVTKPKFVATSRPG